MWPNTAARTGWGGWRKDMGQAEGQKSKKNEKMGEGLKEETPLSSDSLFICFCIFTQRKVLLMALKCLSCQRLDMNASSSLPSCLKHQASDRP